jgi:hypothetical protein
MAENQLGFQASFSRGDISKKTVKHMWVKI